MLYNFKSVVDITVHEGDEGKILLLAAPVKYVEGKEIKVKVVECSNVTTSSDKLTPKSLWLEIVNAAPSTLSIIRKTANGVFIEQQQPWSATASDSYPSPTLIGLRDTNGLCLGAFKLEY